MTELMKKTDAFVPELAALLRWYDVNRRVLPWREDPAPYHVWLSEIMLQQTRVEAVKGYYDRFLKVLPDIRSLAAADEDTYLKLWEGLGYYSRVRNLHKGAVTVMEEYGGEMPRTSAELIRIPGIGPYTAAAIASIAFGECIPAIDGNLLRVFARLTRYEEDIKTEAAKKAAYEFYLAAMTKLLQLDEAAETAKAAAAKEAASTWRPSEKEGKSNDDSGADTLCHEQKGRNIPGDVNQALMDLGATVCLPNAKPLCSECPFAGCCEAHAAGRETEYPLRQEKKERKQEKLTVFLIHDAEKIALRKRPAKGLLAGLYEFPNTPGHLSEKEALQYVQKIGFPPLRIKKLPEAKHIFTHKEWHMTGYEILADELAGYADEPGGSSEDKSKKPAAKAGSGIFLAEINEIRDVYSVPSAFAAYSSLL